jgi:hypothetical protein
MEILDLVEQLGNPAKDEGEWIAKTDLVEEGPKLKLVEQVTHASRRTLPAGALSQPAALLYRCSKEPTCPAMPARGGMQKLEPCSLMPSLAAALPERLPAGAARDVPNMPFCMAHVYQSACPPV